VFMPLTVIANSGVREVILAEVDKRFSVVGCNVTTLSQYVLHTVGNALSGVFRILVTTQSSVRSSADEEASHEVGPCCIVVNVLNSECWCRHAFCTIIVANKVHDKILEALHLEVGCDDVQTKVVMKRMEIGRALKLAVVHPADKQLECKVIKLFIDKRSAKLSL